MKKIYDNWRAGKIMFIWFFCISILFFFALFFGQPDRHTILTVWLVALCFIAAVEILSLYFSYFKIYPDGSFRLIYWFYPKTKVYPKEVVSIGLAARTLDKEYQEYFVEYIRNAKKIQMSVKAYSKRALAQILNHIVTVNPQVQVDTYGKDLLDTYNKTPEKLEGNGQKKLKFKWPISQRLTDLIMFLLFLFFIYLFFHVATQNGWCLGRDNCYPGPII